MSDLKTDYLNDILDASMNGKRHYNIVDSDGNIVQSNVTLEDVTSYTQLGSNYDASDVNEQNGKINEIGAGLEDVESNLKFANTNEAVSISGTNCTVTSISISKFGKCITATITFSLTSTSSEMAWGVDLSSKLPKPVYMNLYATAVHGNLRSSAPCYLDANAVLHGIVSKTGDVYYAQDVLNTSNNNVTFSYIAN